MQIPNNEVADFGRRVGLDGLDAAYLHDAVRFFMAAKSAIRHEQRFCETYDEEQAALYLMRAAMAAKYRPDASGHESCFQPMVEVMENMTGTVESGLDDITEAIRESADADCVAVREIIEVGRILADRCQGIDNGIEALRRVVSAHSDALYKLMLSQGRGR